MATNPLISTGGSGSGVTSITALGSTPNAAGGDIAGTALTLEPADATHPGLLTSGTQTIGGAKTFTGDLVFSGTPTFNNSAKFANGTGLTFLAVATVINTQAGPYGTYSIIHGGNAIAMVLNTSSSGAGEAITFPCSVGYPYPSTLSPSGTTQTVDWTIGSSQKIDAASTTGTLVLTFTFPTDGGRYIIKTLGKTGRVWTFPSSVKWAGGVAPTVTATDGAKDAFQFIYDAGDSTYIGSIIAQNVS